MVQRGGNTSPRICGTPRKIGPYRNGLPGTPRDSHEAALLVRPPRHVSGGRGTQGVERRRPRRRTRPRLEPPRLRRYAARFSPPDAGPALPVEHATGPRFDAHRAGRRDLLRAHAAQRARLRRCAARHPNLGQSALAEARPRGHGRPARIALPAGRGRSRRRRVEGLAERPGPPRRPRFHVSRAARHPATREDLPRRGGRRRGQARLRRDPRPAVGAARRLHLFDLRVRPACLLGPAHRPRPRPPERRGRRAARPAASVLRPAALRVQPGHRAADAGDGRRAVRGVRREGGRGRRVRAARRGEIDLGTARPQGRPPVRPRLPADPRDRHPDQGRGRRDLATRPARGLDFGPGRRAATVPRMGTRRPRLRHDFVHPRRPGPAAEARSDRQTDANRPRRRLESLEGERPRAHGHGPGSDPADGRPDQGQRRLGRVDRPVDGPRRPRLGDARLPVAQVRPLQAAAGRDGRRGRPGEVARGPGGQARRPARPRVAEALPARRGPRRVAPRR